MKIRTGFHTKYHAYMKGHFMPADMNLNKQICDNLVHFRPLPGQNVACPNEFLYENEHLAQVQRVG